MEKDIYLPENKIIISNRPRFLKSKFKGFQETYSIDTETLKGKCKLICDSSNRYLLDPTFEEILDFLMFNAGKSLYRACYNLEYDFSSMVKVDKKLTADEIKRLYNKELITYGKYTLLYYPRTLLKIARPDHHHTVYYTDLFNFFRPRSLNKACRHFLGKQKYDKIDPKILNVNKKYWEKNLDDIIYYCKMDARLTKELYDFFLYHVRQTRLNMPKYFTSYASLTKQNFRYYCRIPSIDIDKIPIEVLDVAQTTYSAHRIELLKRGTFEKCYLYDINNAFPFTISKLPSLKYGRFVKVDQISDKETIGFYKIVCKIPEDIYISPMPHIIGKGHRNKLSIFPYGVFGKWVTWYEAKLLQKFDCIRQFNAGWEYKKGYGEFYPYEKIIKVLYAGKEYNKKKGRDLVSAIFKGTSVAGYGVMAEKHKTIDEEIESAGVLYNPIYASIIPAETRYKLLTSIREKDYEHVIGFHADAIFSEKKLNIPLSDKLGDWDLKDEGRGIFINTGRYQVGDTIKRRGFSGKGLNWANLLQEFSEKDFIGIPEKHVISMKEALLMRNDKETVNLFIDQFSHLRINSDRKRIWDRDFKNCKDVLTSNMDSKPKEVYYFS